MNLRDKLPYFLKYAQEKSDEKFETALVFDGNSYIDTGMPITANSKLEVDFQSDKAVGETFESIFGAQANTSGVKRLSCIITSTNAATRFVLSSDAYINIADHDINFTDVADANNRHIYGIDVNTVTAYIDSQTYTGIKYNTQYTSNYSVYIMARNNIGVATNFAKGKLYGVKHWEGDELVQDLRPHVDQNGVPCMYDTVSKKCLYNQGTGDLTVV